MTGIRFPDMTAALAGGVQAMRQATRTAELALFQQWAQMMRGPRVDADCRHSYTPDPQVTRDWLDRNVGATHDTVSDCEPTPAPVELYIRALLVAEHRASLLHRAARAREDGRTALAEFYETQAQHAWLLDVPGAPRQPGADDGG